MLPKLQNVHSGLKAVSAGKFYVI